MTDYPTRYRAVQDEAARRQIATLPAHCTGACNQGRRLCAHPVECFVSTPLAPAEAATDIGADLPPVKHGPWDGWGLFLALCASGGLIAAAVAVVLSNVKT